MSTSGPTEIVRPPLVPRAVRISAKFVRHITGRTFTGPLARKGAARERNKREKVRAKAENVDVRMLGKLPSSQVTGHLA